jgi:hypothetical protein
MRAVLAVFAVFLAAGVTPAQTPVETANLLSLTDHLQSAIDAEDWPRAAELSRALRQAVTESRNTALANKSEEQINAALGWLPANTETVIVAKEAFKLDFNSRRSSAPPGALRLMQSYTLTPVSSRAAEELTAKLEGQTLRFAVFAARRFQNHQPGAGNAVPHGLIAYQGCGLYGMAKPVAGQPMTRPPDESLMGYPTWTARGGGAEYPAAGDSRAETIFIAQPKPDLLLACNDRNFFSEILARIDAPPRARAFAQDGPELKLVDRSAPLWAFRRFLPERAGVDPSYPSGGGVMGIADTDASAVVFEAGAPKMAIRAQWISKSRVNPWQALAAIPDFRGTAKVQMNRDGLWQIAVEQDGSASLYAALALMGILGFVTVV